MMRCAKLGERAIECWQEQEREAEALRVAAIWEAHMAMDRAERMRMNGWKWLMLVVGTCFWVALFWMLLRYL